MAIAGIDERELLTVLHDGQNEAPRWATFLGRLRRRVQADHVALIFRQGDAPIHRTTQYFAGRNIRQQAQALEPLTSLDPIPYDRLRPGRVYDSDEMIGQDDPATERFRREFLARIGVRAGRFMRVTEPEGASAWLVMVRSEGEFSAADSALIANLAPHLSIALRNFVMLERERFRAKVSGEALRRAGIGWTAVDEEGRMLDAGPDAYRIAAAEAVSVPIPAQPLAALSMPATILLARRARPLTDAHARAFARLHRLPNSEARLAIELANGRSLVEAAASLGITIDTARSYSKALFAKTATHGQADLIRLMLTSTATLA